jgi:hypothetical protein
VEPDERRGNVYCTATVISPYPAAQHLLQLAGVDGVRLVGSGFELQPLSMEEHPHSSGLGIGEPRIAPGARPETDPAAEWPQEDSGSAARKWL